MLAFTGRFQMKTDHPADALTSYERVLQLKPEYGLVSGHLAEAYGRIALDLMASENTAKNMAAAQEALNQRFDTASRCRAVLHESRSCVLFSLRL